MAPELQESQNTGAAENSTGSGHSVSALGQLVGYNDVVVVADPDHTDGNISKAVKSELQAMKNRGANHLFLEHDSSEYSKERAMSGDSQYAQLVREANHLGMHIHLYDDRSKERALDARFSEEATLRHETDKYLDDKEGLIARAENPERMREYLATHAATHDERVQFRNERMVENIAKTMEQYPGERAVVMMGSGHLNGTNDVDEGLRKEGLRTTTVDIN